MEWIALVLFVLLVVSWLALPNSKKVESRVELGSIGDEVKAAMPSKS
jgi:hypothetical protein